MRSSQLSVHVLMMPTAAKGRLDQHDQNSVDLTRSRRFLSMPNIGECRQLVMYDEAAFTLVHSHPGTRGTVRSSPNQSFRAVDAALAGFAEIRSLRGTGMLGVVSKQLL